MRRTTARSSEDQYEHNAICLQALLLAMLQLRFRPASLIDQESPKPIIPPCRLAGTQLDQLALTLEHLG